MPDPATTASPPGRPRSLRFLPLLVLVLILVAGVQLWISTAGFAAWSRGSRYVSLMADAFLHGQLSLTISPPPELLALPDPYDPLANSRYRLQDVLLYNGKYYLYWGPAPALLTAAVCRVIGVTPDFTDQHLVFVFAFGGVIAACVLAFGARAKFFPQLGLGTILMPVISLGLGAPVLFTLARPAIYEAEICAGQFFLLAGFCAAFRGMTRPPANRASATRWLTAAGILWALSAGSRISLIPGIAVTEAVTLWFLFRSPRRSIMAALGLIAPLVAAVALLGCFNYARFHSFTEFGLRWQLAGRNEHAQSPDDLFRLRYLPINAYCYLLAAPLWLGEFPFVRAPGHLPAFAHLFNLPDGFRIESVVGLIWSQPVFIFAILGLLVLLRRKPIPPDSDRSDHSLKVWLTTSLATAAFLGFAPALVFETVTMRYLLDAVPCLTILAALGYWRVLDSLPPQRRRLANGVVALLLIGQSLLGLLLAITGYYGNFLFYNPSLYQSIKAFFDRW
jgi:hypothetical protein